MKKPTTTSHRTKRLRTVALITAPLALATCLHAQAIWIDGIGTAGDHDGSGNWDDITKWSTGTVPSGTGITVDFVNAYTDSNIQPRIRANQEPHQTDGKITVGILNFEDTAPDANDGNFAYEGETDFILLGNSTGSTLYFDNGGAGTLNGPAAVINFLNCFRAETLRVGGTDLLSIDGANGILVNTSGAVILDGANTFSGPLVVRSADSGPLTDLGDGTNTVPNAPDGTADGDGGGDGYIEVQHNEAFGATGPGNETVFMGDGGTDQFGDNNRKEGALHFKIDDNGTAFFDPGVDPALDGSRPLGGNGGLTTGYTVEEEFFFRYFPAGDGVSARKIWEDAINILDDVPVTLNGDIHFERGVDWDGFIIGEDALSQSGSIEEGNVRWEIQVGDTALSSNVRGAWDTNHESLTINGDIFINDQSGGTTEGRFENNLELNPVNVDSTLTINGAIGSNAAVARDADPGDLLTNLRYQGILKNGDGTTTLGGDNEFDGNAYIQRGTLAISHVGALDDAWVLRLGQGGTNPADELRFMVAAPGTFLIRDNGSGNGVGPIQLEDLIGNPTTDFDIGNEVTYVLGMSAPGAAILDGGDTIYQGDGWNNANGGSRELDSLDLTLELTAVAGAQLTYKSRIQGQLLAGDAIDPGAGNLDPFADLGTVTLNKTGAGTIILNPGGSLQQYSGPTNVLAGILLTDGNLQKTTSINVSSGASFGGEGNIGDDDDADTVLDRATDGIDNDNDGFADALDPEMDETGLYYDSDGNPLTGPGDYLGGINKSGDPGTERPKVNTAVSFANGADLEIGLRDATQISQLGTLNLEGSVSFAGNNELRFNIGGPNDNSTGRDRFNVNNVNTAASPNGEIVFSGTDTETFVFAEAPGLPIEARNYSIISTDNGFSGITLPVMGSGPAGFTYEVRAAGGNPNNIIVHVEVAVDADTDGDGISDFLEDAFDTDKNDPSSGPEGLPHVVTDGGVQKLRFRTLDIPAGRTYEAEQSTDAGDTVPWAIIPGAPAASADQSQATPNTTIMEVVIGAGLPKNFGRVLVTQ